MSTERKFEPGGRRQAALITTGILAMVVSQVFLTSQVVAGYISYSSGLALKPSGVASSSMLEACAARAEKLRLDEDLRWLRDTCKSDLKLGSGSNAYRSSYFAPVIAYGVRNALIVENYATGAVDVIAGDSGKLKDVQAVDFLRDASGPQVVALDRGAKMIATFPAGQSGNLAPIRRILDEGFADARDLAVGSAKNLLFVAVSPEGENGEIWVYSARGHFIGSGALESPAVRWKIAGPDTLLKKIHSIAHDEKRDELYVLNENGERELLVFSTLPGAPMRPVRIVRGPATLLGSAIALGFDASKGFVQALTADNKVLRYGPDANENVAPK